MKIIGLIANLTKDPSGIKTRRIVEIARSLDIGYKCTGVHDIIKVGEPIPEQHISFGYNCFGGGYYSSICQGACG